MVTRKPSQNFWYMILLHWYLDQKTVFQLNRFITLFVDLYFSNFGCGIVNRINASNCLYLYVLLIRSNSYYVLKLQSRFYYIPYRCRTRYSLEYNRQQLAWQPLKSGIYSCRSRQSLLYSIFSANPSQLGGGRSLRLHYDSAYRLEQLCYRKQHGIKYLLLSILKLNNQSSTIWKVSNIHPTIQYCTYIYMVLLFSYCRSYSVVGQVCSNAAFIMYPLKPYCNQIVKTQYFNGTNLYAWP